MIKNLIVLSFCCSVWITCKQPEVKSTDFSRETSSKVEYGDLALQDFLAGYETNKNNAMLLDVRTPPEFNDGTIPGAIMINYLETDIDQQLAKLDKSKKYYVFCQQGGRSHKCMDKMKTMGFQSVYNLTGGYDAYLNQKEVDKVLGK